MDVCLAIVDELQDGLQLLGVGLPHHDDGIRCRIAQEHLLEVGAGNRLENREALDRLRVIR